MDTVVYYLGRDPLFETEKPYTIDFPVESIPGAKRTNHTIDGHDVKAHPFHENDGFNLDANGFCATKWPTHLKAQDLITRDYTRKHEYWQEIQKLLLSKFPEYRRVECFDFTIRKRSPDFPAQRPGFAEFQGPATRAHSDNSGRSSLQMVKRLFPRHNGYFDDKDLDMVNVWRVVEGSDDWPLALCDYSTINKDEDIRDTDSLRIDRIDEATQLHFNEKHKWYYIPDQTPEDVLIFRNSDTHDTRARGFHCAIDLPKTTDSKRVSVEVRCVCVR